MIFTRTETSTEEKLYPWGEWILKRSYSLVAGMGLGQQNPAGAHPLPSLHLMQDFRPKLWGWRLILERNDHGGLNSIGAMTLPGIHGQRATHKHVTRSVHHNIVATWSYEDARHDGRKWCKLLGHAMARVTAGIHLDKRKLDSIQGRRVEPRWATRRTSG